MAAKIRERSLCKSKEKGQMAAERKEKTQIVETLPEIVETLPEIVETLPESESVDDEDLIRLRVFFNLRKRLPDLPLYLLWPVVEFIKSLGFLTEEERRQLISKYSKKRPEEEIKLSIVETIVARDPMDTVIIECPPSERRALSAKLLKTFVSSLNDVLRMFRAWRLILVRLPANELLCYQLVCKLWRSIISSEGFTSAHLRHSKSNPTSHVSLLVHEAVAPYAKSTIRFPSKSITYCFARWVAVVGSVNGLICVVGNDDSDSKIYSADSIWILNPVTGHIMKLPVPSESPFDYRNQTAAFVFWWDSISDEYKVAMIVSKPNSTTVASVWASGSPETWSEISVGFKGSYYNPPSMVTGCDIVIGDIAYWVVFQLNGGHVGKLFVLSLDLKTLSLSLKNPFPLHFMKPKALCGFRDNFMLVPDNSFLFAANWKGNFALVEKDEEKQVYNVWTMDDDCCWRIASSFVVEFSINRCVNHINRKSILTRVVGRNRIGISLFDLEKGEGELIQGYKYVKFLTSAHDFVGSFVSIKGFKPPEAYGLSQLPLLRILWPCPSASKMSTNCYLVPGHKRKWVNESENESEDDA